MFFCENYDLCQQPVSGCWAVWPCVQMAVSGRYPVNSSLDCFQILPTHVHPLAGVDVPLGVMTFDLIILCHWI